MRWKLCARTSFTASDGPALSEGEVNRRKTFMLFQLVICRNGQMRKRPKDRQLP